MAPNEETDLSKATQILIHTECSGADMKPRTKELEISPGIYQGDCRVLKDTDKKLPYLGGKLSIL